MTSETSNLCRCPNGSYGIRHSYGCLELQIERLTKERDEAQERFEEYRDVIYNEACIDRDRLRAEKQALQVELDHTVASHKRAHETSAPIPENCTTDPERGTRLVGPHGGLLEEMPNPTDADLTDPLFEAIWQVTKRWDVNVPSHYVGYCGMNGSHVMLILNAIRSAREPPPGHWWRFANIRQIIQGNAWVRVSHAREPDDEQVVVLLQKDFDRLVARANGSVVETTAERTPADYAIEHAEYMAQAAERLIDADNLLSIDGTPMDAIDQHSHASRQLQTRIYEFRKRAERVKRADKATAQPPVDNDHVAQGCEKFNE